MIRRYCFEHYQNLKKVGGLKVYISGAKRLNENDFPELTEIFNLTNVVKTQTCFKVARGSLLDVLFTNKPNFTKNLSL